MLRRLDVDRASTWPELAKAKKFADAATGIEVATTPMTIAESLNAKRDSLTRAERQLADAILDGYPVSGLGSITELAEKAAVSTPTVARMVQKLGFSGYAQFQASLRRELEAAVSNPIDKRDTWATLACDQHVLNRFTEAVTQNVRRTLAQIEPDTFDAICGLIADPSRRVFIVGGRITHAVADYFFLHLQVVRSGVTLIQSNSNAWPHHLLDLKPGDVIVVFDVRRYENSTLLLAEIAHERKAEIVLFTDQWRSPVAKVARHCLCAHIAVPSAWDSSIASILLIEAVIASVQEAHWQETKGRMEELEDMFDRTRLFRKFV